MRPKFTSRTAMARRIGLVTGVVALVVGLSAPTAMASPPTREYAAGPDHIDLAAGEACAFPVGIDILVNGEYSTTHVQRSGAAWTHISGRLIVRVSNGDSSVRLNVSGPVRVVPADDGSSTYSFYGNALIWAPTYLIVTSGPVALAIAPDGSLVSVDASRGHVTDVCALIS